MYYIIRASAVVRFYALHICAWEYSLFMWWAFKQGKSNRDTFVDAHLSPFAEMKSAVLYQANMREIVCWAIIEIVCIYFHFFFLFRAHVYTLGHWSHTMHRYECLRVHSQMMTFLLLYNALALLTLMLVQKYRMSILYRWNVQISYFNVRSHPICKPQHNIINIIVVPCEHWALSINDFTPARTV